MHDRLHFSRDSRKGDGRVARPWEVMRAYAPSLGVRGSWDS